MAKKLKKVVKQEPKYILVDLSERFYTINQTKQDIENYYSDDDVEDREIIIIDKNNVVYEVVKETTVKLIKKSKLDF